MNGLGIALICITIIVCVSMLGPSTRGCELILKQFNSKHSLLIVERTDADKLQEDELHKVLKRGY